MEWVTDVSRTPLQHEKIYGVPPKEITGYQPDDVTRGLGTKLMLQLRNYNWTPTLLGASMI